MAERQINYRTTLNASNEVRVACVAYIGGGSTRLDEIYLIEPNDSPGHTLEIEDLSVACVTWLLEKAEDEANTFDDLGRDPEN